jgi:hypothetical protein
MTFIASISLLLLLSCSSSVLAQSTSPPELSEAALPVATTPATQMQVETTVIQGNTELPKYLYVVPWQEKRKKNQAAQKVTLHNIYGDILEPKGIQQWDHSAFEQHVARAKKKGL